MIISCDLVSVSLGSSFVRPVHIINLVGVQDLEVVDGHLQNFGFLQLGGPGLLEGLRHQTFELVERTVDPIPATFFDDAASTFARRTSVNLRAGSHGTVAAALSVLLRTVVAVTDTVTPLQVCVVHF
jgi:hypothetical protein